MAYEFRILRYQLIGEVIAGKFCGAIQYATETIVDTGNIPVANEAGLQVVNNVLAMRSDARVNGLTSDATTGWLFVVSWIRSPRGPKRRLFKYNARKLWDSRTPTNRYSVRFEVRQRGAIGSFEWITREVSAHRKLHAVSAVFMALQREGYETRFGDGHRVDVCQLN